MRKLILILSFAALLGVAAGPAITGSAAKKKHPISVTKRIIKDCSRDGKLNRHYTRKALRRALKRLPEDIDGYTDCRSAIRKAIRRLNRKHRH